MTKYDVLIRNGRIFDGEGNSSFIGDIAVSGGKIMKIDKEILGADATKIYDAKGLWVTPGFIDFHTHYDAEVEASPGLKESVMHGVTTVTMGSCSLSLCIGTAEDLADMFSRVEAIPREQVLPLLREKKRWNTMREYSDHLASLPLGPNVSTFLGHSAIRAHVMGLERSLTKGLKPTEQEMRRMEELLKEAIDCGYLGFSINTLTWDKMDGNRFRSRPLPSTYAKWSEISRLNRIVREKGRVFQGVPNVSTKYNVLLFFKESVGLFRKKLKTTIISLMDPRSNRGIYRLVAILTRIVNTIFGGDVRLQAVPAVFDLYADGVDVVVFEEFGAGTAAIHLADLAERRKLLLDKGYRKWFRRQWTNWFLPRVFHRDFNQSKIVECPDQKLIGKSFVELAKERNEHVVETFLDLCAQYGNDIRWYTVIGNDRKGPLKYIVSHPDVLIGFSDAGAHLRGMAHYNFPLRFLKLVRDAELEGKPFLSAEKAVWRVTGEIADWFGLDTGKLKIGAQADIVLLDPNALDEEIEKIREVPMEEFGGIVRLVRRNPKAIRAVLINGKAAVENGNVLPEIGKENGFGRFMAYKEKDYLYNSSRKEKTPVLS
ncbi:N-acyl-D-glutamate amidohydrolase [Leptospira wolffii]|uniref:N-acyl-D-amino-acid deacylase family protein n=1 Tax=Leptospira wolffii TaxID=409998 RepID=UPI0010825D1A|nr:amidohydrolase family protein [Leptospira wolffii]TGK62209.1 N-acyl-D-glutamate amidohydrolase [Leptospira wolffii]TGK66580.1 N-acyl-D-glutamate amidohydrolase [Leptospira wolffii]TGK74407.1 N-acyl-D-glutamate amidohydrolase [Leptospira wolffii]TGL32018.1 N-acyl-D-glutamate amidohydrolase [Leptospira wolffii]